MPDLVCQRDCYNSTTLKYYERGVMYPGEDDRELEGRGLMKFFKPLNALPPKEADALADKAEARQEYVNRVARTKVKEKRLKEAEETVRRLKR